MKTRALAVFAVLLAVLFVAASPALADNIAIANATVCNGTPPGGTICSTAPGACKARAAHRLA